ncbi:hypothetical protein ES708_12729 [subsurface metagenome]
MALLPFEQGELDGLCGIYSVVNAVKLIAGRLSEYEATVLFEKILAYIETKHSIGAIMTEGIGTRDMIGIVKHVLRNDYGIGYRRPFLRSKNRSFENYLEEISIFLHEGSPRAVIVSLDHKEWEHWTVIRSISPQLIHLFDSSDMKRLNKERCTIQAPTSDRPYMLNPSDTFFLTKVASAPVRTI